MINPSNKNYFLIKTAIRYFCAADRMVSIGLVLSLIMLLVPSTCLAKGSNALYQIGSVEVSVPHTKNRNPRATGMTQAKQIAFERLLHRMLTRADRAAHQGFLQTLRRNLDTLTERVTVVSETRRPNDLLLTVDVTFSQESVRNALTQEGLLYNEVLYPTVLFVLKEKNSVQSLAEPSYLLQEAVQTEAASFALSVVKPLGDVDDLMHLSWELAAKDYEPLRQWALSRYSAGKVWAMLVTLQQGGGRIQGGQSSFVANAQLLGGHSKRDAHSPGEPLEVKINGDDLSTVCPKGEGQKMPDCLYPVLVRRLLQKMMDQWILDHGIHPGALHKVHLRVLHGLNLSTLADFMKGLQAIPGLGSVKVLAMRATESELQVEFQGQDEQLHRGIVRLGGQIEQKSVINPVEESIATETDPLAGLSLPRTEIVLRLP